MSLSVPLLLLLLSMASSCPSRRFHFHRRTRLSSHPADRCFCARRQTDVNVFILQTSSRCFPGEEQQSCDVGSSTHFSHVNFHSSAVQVFPLWGKSMILFEFQKLLEEVAVAVVSHSSQQPQPGSGSFLQRVFFYLLCLQHPSSCSSDGNSDSLSSCLPAALVATGVSCHFIAFS